MFFLGDDVFTPLSANCCAKCGLPSSTPSCGRFGLSCFFLTWLRLPLLSCGPSTPSRGPSDYRSRLPLSCGPSTRRRSRSVLTWSRAWRVRSCRPTRARCWTLATSVQCPGSPASTTTRAARSPAVSPRATTCVPTSEKPTVMTTVSPNCEYLVNPTAAGVFRHRRRGEGIASDAPADNSRTNGRSE